MSWLQSIHPTERLARVGCVVALVAGEHHAERPAVRLRDALRASLYLAVRRWYLTALSLVVLVLLVQVVATRPAIGLGLVASPLLYVVWANSRFSLRPALDPAQSTVPERAPRGRAAVARA